jgi:hypothetical protein
MALTDEQWAVLEPLIGEMPRRADGRGRHWRRSREVFDGILWILQTGGAAKSAASSTSPSVSSTAHSSWRKKEGCVGATKRGTGSKLMAMADRFGLPLAAGAAAATPLEVRLVAPTLDSRFVADLPQWLIGDQAYDADPLDAALRRADRAAPPGRNRPRRRMGVPCVVTSAAGRLSASSLGWATSAVWSCAMSATRSTTRALSTLAVS